MSSASTGAASVLRHVVLASFQPTSSADDIAGMAAAFAKLPSQIEEIIDFEWGDNVSPEGKAEGYTHCFLVTFRDEAGRDAYLPHPAHQAFVKLWRPHLEKVLVLDYWTRT